MIKNFSKEVNAIKRGLARDGFDTIVDKIKFLVEDNCYVTNLKNLAVSCFDYLNLDEIDDYKLMYKIKLNKLNRKTNYIPQYIFAVISSMISIFAIIFSFFASFFFGSIEIEQGLRDFTESDISDLSYVINSNFETFMTQLIPWLVIAIIIIFIASVLLTKICDKRRIDSIIYYSFILDCIEIAEVTIKNRDKEAKKEDNKDTEKSHH